MKLSYHPYFAVNVKFVIDDNNRNVIKHLDHMQDITCRIVTSTVLLQ